MKENLTKNDLECLVCIRNGDENALACLMRNHFTDIYRYAIKFTSNDALIKDCIQEVFISLWQRRETADKIISPRFYLLGSIKNRVLKALEKMHTVISGIALMSDDIYAYDDSIEDSIIAKHLEIERHERLRNILQYLSDREMEVVYLKYYKYLSNKQIAKRMQISLQSVYNLQHVALEKLRRQWTKKVTVKEMKYHCCAISSSLN